MSTRDGITTNDWCIATILKYLGVEFSHVTFIDDGSTSGRYEFTFKGVDDSYVGDIKQQYEAGQLACTDSRALLKAHAQVGSFQKLARRSRDGVFTGGHHTKERRA